MLKTAIAALGLGMAMGMSLASPVLAADAPSEIKLGTLYASSGRYASI
jgi:branched-chain amino acid transport system substrate-binding protein